MGELVPVNCMECIPGDRISISSEAMFRMMPMISPIMHKVDVTIHHFFVPNRIIWPGWENFISPSTSTMIPPTMPYLDLTGAYNTVLPSSISDYLGLPLGNYEAITDQPISALPHMAFQRIWAEYYRPQDIVEIEDVNSTYSCINGEQDSAKMAILMQKRYRAWEHDYFTSALPWAQKGDAVELPIDIVGDVDVVLNVTGAGGKWVKGVDGSSMIDAYPIQGLAGPGGPTFSQAAFDDGIDTPAVYDPAGSLIVDGEDFATTITINDLRTAYALQNWLEKNARAGTRYQETILAHFGVRSSDKRIQRPEYIGGSKASMAISEVLQTSATESETPQGNMAGHGISITAGVNNSYFVEEHGYMMSILSIRPKTAYMQGLPRHFQKMTRDAIYWPDFAFLGEQEIFNKELMFNFDEPEVNNETFGYIPRYTEYRYLPSRAAGQMRTTLDFWHMARKFDDQPALNANFINCDATKRIFAVEDPEQDEIVAHVYHKIIARRPLPLWGNPGGLM